MIRFWWLEIINELEMKRILKRLIRQGPRKRQLDDVLTPSNKLELGLLGISGLFHLVSQYN